MRMGPVDCGARLGLVAILAALAVVGPAPVHAASPPGTTCPVFPSDNIWNTDISSLPVNSHSAAWLSSTGATAGRKLHPDFGGPYGVDSPITPSNHADRPTVLRSLWREYPERG